MIPAGIEVGFQLPPITIPITRTTVVRYAGASTDFNPIHYSDHAARELGFEQVVAHGMLTMAAALRVVTDWVGDPDEVSEYFVRFINPVLVPDDAMGARLEVSGTVTAVDDKRVTISIEATCAGQKILGAAKAVVRRSNG